ncbi:oligosaccharide flippase family protein [Vibrio breoganii]
MISRNIEPHSFSIYLLIMATIGYTGFMELGISRALIKSFSQCHNNTTYTALIFSTSFWLLFFLGIITSFLLYTAPSLINLFFEIPLAYELFFQSLKLVSFSIPAIFITQIYYSYYEGNLHFKNILFLKLFTLIIETSIQCYVVIITNSLNSLIISVVITKYISLLICMFLMRNRLMINMKFSLTISKDLLHFGGWVTVSNLIGPIMVYFDRFYTSSVVSFSMSSQYLAASELVQKSTIIPSSISRVVFVILSRTGIDKVENSYLSILLVTLPLSLFFFVFSEDILNLWLGIEVTKQSAISLKILSIGLLLNAFAQIPCSKLLSKNRARSVALIHMLELVPYLLCLYYSVEKWGVIGAATVWTFRNGIDFILLLITSIKQDQINERSLS